LSVDWFLRTCWLCLALRHAGLNAEYPSDAPKTLCRYNVRVLEFGTPSWLYVPVAAGVLGVWALWRGQRRRRSVSSVRLWRGLEGEGTAKRRLLDPLWVLVLAAAVFAGIALARPCWVGGRQPPPPLDVTWAVRSPRAAADGAPRQAEAWVRCAAEDGAVTLSVNGAHRPVSAAELRQGVALPVQADAQGRVVLQLRSGSAEAGATFTDTGSASPFGLLEIAAPAAGIDPALRRVFAVQANRRAGDPTVHPRVLLVNDSQVRAEDLQDADLVIAQSVTPLAGILPGAAIQGEWAPQVESGSGFAWPSFVSLKFVQVRTLRQAAISADWRIIATAGGRPWIAAREIPHADGTKALWLWLASTPLTDCDWVKDPGFVLFFAEMQQRAFSGERTPYVDWTRLPDTAVESAAAPLALAPYAGVAAMALLLGAMVWFVRRAR
jgi:hypothetical protein